MEEFFERMPDDRQISIRKFFAHIFKEIFQGSKKTFMTKTFIDWSEKEIAKLKR